MQRIDIVVRGAPKAGKSTIAAIVARALREAGFAVDVEDTGAVAVTDERIAACVAEMNQGRPRHVVVSAESVARAASWA